MHATCMKITNAVRGSPVVQFFPPCVGKCPLPKELRTISIDAMVLGTRYKLSMHDMIAIMQGSAPWLRPGIFRDLEIHASRKIKADFIKTNYVTFQIFLSSGPSAFHLAETYFWKSLNFPLGCSLNHSSRLLENIRFKYHKTPLPGMRAT